MKRKPYPDRFNKIELRCACCNFNMRKAKIINHSYGPWMLRFDVWARAAGKKYLRRCVCLSCILKLLGRPPTDRDAQTPWWPWERRSCIGRIYVLMNPEWR